MIKLKVNNKEVEVPEGATVMQACEAAGEEIPRFCYHERLSIAGNCRMCLVEVEKSPKPVASCAMPVADDMVIKTNTEKVEKARKGVMEFLLINHPLDCPICDQGGECDLQDQSLYFGKSTSRYEDTKRAVEDKNFGPLIKTVMTRCIHCTRCVRFMDEVAGTHELGAINRGEGMEIMAAIEGGITSELSGNIIDLCPVGALTSKPYAFTARSWELNHNNSIDISDAVGSNIRIDEFNGEIKRILPRENDKINQEWLSDKGRFFYDGLSNQRLDKPFYKKSSKLVPCDWSLALKIIVEKLKLTNPDNVAAVSGALTDIETMYTAKEFFKNINVNNIDCRFNLSNIPTSNASDWLFNSGIENIDKIDKLFVIGCDPRREAAVLNSRIRQRWLTGNLDILSLCTPNDLSYKFKSLGDDISSLCNITVQNNIKRFFENSKFPMVILGDSILTSKQGENIHNLVKIICQDLNIIRSDWNGFNVLNKYASRIGGLSVGFVPYDGGMSALNIKNSLKDSKLKILFLIEADDFDVNIKDLKNAFVIYIGHHGDRYAGSSDIVLPTTAFTEKKSLFVNLEGRPQFTKKITSNLGKAVDAWKIFKALDQKISDKIKFNNHSELLKSIFENYPSISNIGNYVAQKWIKTNKKKVLLTSEKNNFNTNNFYQTCSISRSSENMANCVKTILKSKKVKDEFI
ncbi:MAG: NADH-quinone oxidoreductase chain 3 [Alphaproteobacteria bacterium MarineAlpha9_Bin4]|nr:NADH-quinone oxidoreductase subunit G [Pelagibacterales bacterium]PPR27525.1 MAG: NADH-quinone oxidoreductase chain 3 [Alphaproteobacteria bacterium MarineAlpha9_Bin4]